MLFTINHNPVVLNLWYKDLWLFLVSIYFLYVRLNHFINIIGHYEFDGHSSFSELLPHPDMLLNLRANNVNKICIKLILYTNYINCMVDSIVPIWNLQILCLVSSSSIRLQSVFLYIFPQHPNFFFLNCGCSINDISWPWETGVRWEEAVSF